MSDDEGDYADEAERLDQQVTRTLRAIDSNFAKAADVATGMLTDVKGFAGHMKQVHGSAQVRACLQNCLVQWRVAERVRALMLVPLCRTIGPVLPSSIAFLRTGVAAFLRHVQPRR